MIKGGGERCLPNARGVAVPGFDDSNPLTVEQPGWRPLVAGARWRRMAHSRAGEPALAWTANCSEGYDVI